MTTQRKRQGPYVEHYPALRDWLHKRGARCDWQNTRPIGESRSLNQNVEQWHMPNGRSFLIVVHADGRGWDLYTALDTNKIGETLADAESRLDCAPRGSGGDNGDD